jgi:hypothetical protein
VESAGGEYHLGKESPPNFWNRNTPSGVFQWEFPAGISLLFTHKKLMQSS